MSMLSKQVKELRELANSKELEMHEPVTYGFYGKIKSKLFRAADTIEALSAKLQAANMENGCGWILCEDRLPELNCFYTVTIFDGEDCRVEPAYYAKIGYLGMRELKPNWWTDCTSNAEMIEDGEDKVIAWQPLPEPYRP